MRPELKRPDHRRFCLLLGLLLCLIFVRYAFQVNFPSAVYLVFILLITALGSPTEIIAMCMACIPLHECIDFFYAVVICIAVFAAKYHRSIRINGALFLILTMVIWELLHCFAYTFGVREFLVDIIPLLAIAVVMCIDPKAYDYDFVVRTLAIATACLCLTLLTRVLYTSGFQVAKAIVGLQRLGMETGKQSLTDKTGSVNPNTLGIVCVLATTGLMQLRSAGRKKKGDIWIAMALMVFGALTSSRTYLVCLAAMFFLLIFAQEGSVNKKLRFLGFVFLIVLVALIALYLFFPDLLSYYIGRFFEADITTGRNRLMVDYHNFIVSEPKVLFFGVGLHHFEEKVLSVYRVTSHVPHNGIQELVAAWGLIGGILFGVFLFMMVSQSRRHCKVQRLMNHIPVLILLLKVQAGQMLASSYTMLAFCYAYLSMCQDFSSGRKNRDRAEDAP